MESNLSERIFDYHFDVRMCEILHYDRKIDKLSELLLYMHDERKFSKKCIIEFHVKRIKFEI